MLWLRILLRNQVNKIVKQTQNRLRACFMTLISCQGSEPNWRSVRKVSKHLCSLLIIETWSINFVRIKVVRNIITSTSKFCTATHLRGLEQNQLHLFFCTLQSEECIKAEGTFVVNLWPVLSCTQYALHSDSVTIKCLQQFLFYYSLPWRLQEVLT
jgi:hypothetical protein